MTSHGRDGWLVLAAAGLAGGAAVVGGASSPSAEVLLGLGWAIVTGAVVLVGVLRPDPLEWLVLAAVAWGAGSAVLAGGAPLAGKETVAGWLTAWVALAAARRATDGAAEGLRLVMMASAVLIAAGILLEFTGLGRPRVGGPFFNPNVAAALLVPVMPLAWSGVGWRRWRWAVGVLVGVAVVATGSRAALIALAAAAAVAPQRRIWRWLLGAGGALLVGATAWWRFHLSPDPLAWYRLRIWRSVLCVFAGSPLYGVGPGGLADAAGAGRPPSPSACGVYGHRILYAESSVLGWLVATGIVGAVLAAAVLVAAWRESRRGGWTSDPAWRGVVVSLAVLAAVHDFLLADSVLWWWAVVAGSLLPARDRSRAAGGRLRWGWTTLAVAVVLWGTVQPGWARWLGRDGSDAGRVDRQLRLEPWLDSAPRVRAQYLLNLGERWRPGEAGEALLRAEEAVEAHPGSAICWATLAQANRRVVADLGRWPTAVAAARSAYARACSLEPHVPWYRLDWARLERSAGDLDRARQLVLHVTRDEPNCVPAWLLLGRVELDRGRPAAAREALARAREARLCGRGRLLSAYERALLSAPKWQWRELEGALP